MACVRALMAVHTALALLTIIAFRDSLASVGLQACAAVPRENQAHDGSLAAIRRAQVQVQVMVVAMQTLA